MENPTITIPDWGTFAFVRSIDPVSFGEGNWVVVSARSKNLVPNMILSSVEQNDLTTIARERNMQEVGNFRKNPPKPEKTKEPRAPRDPNKPRARKSGLMVSFNPWAGK